MIEKFDDEFVYNEVYSSLPNLEEIVMDKYRSKNNQWGDFKDTSNEDEYLGQNEGENTMDLNSPYDENINNELGRATSNYADDFNVMPPIVDDINYVQGFLRKNIGSRVKVDFLIGTTNTEDRIGDLVEVGISYIVLKDINNKNLIMCDMYSIKFVTIYNNPLEAI